MSRTDHLQPAHTVLLNTLKLDTRKIMKAGSSHSSRRGHTVCHAYPLTFVGALVCSSPLPGLAENLPTVLIIVIAGCLCKFLSDSHFNSHSWNAWPCLYVCARPCLYASSVIT